MATAFALVFLMGGFLDVLESFDGFDVLESFDGFDALRPGASGSALYRCINNCMNDRMTTLVSTYCCL